MNRSKRISIERYLQQKKWHKAQKAILDELKTNKKDAWLLVRLSRTYLNTGIYKKATEIAARCYHLAPHNPEVIWDYGEAFYAEGSFTSSLKIFKKLLNLVVSEFQKKMGHSKSWDRILKNACRFKIANCHLQMRRLVLCIRWLQLYIRNYTKGAKNPYPLRYVRKRLEEVKRLKKAVDNREPMVWISLLEVKTNSENRAGRSDIMKAFTNGLVFAKSSKAAEKAFKDELYCIGFDLIAAESTEEYARRCLNSDVDDELRELAKSVAKKKNAQFGVFCTYP